MTDPLDNFDPASNEKNDRAIERSDTPSADADIDADAPVDPRLLDRLQDAYISKGRERDSPWPPRPGVFVVLWPLFLLIGSVVAAAPHLMAKYVDDSVVMPAIRYILGAYVLGLTVLLPMIRLSQRRSSDPVIEGAMDAFSLLLPLQPLLWFTVAPPIDVAVTRVLAVDLVMVFWTAIIVAWVGLTLGHEAARGEAINPTRRSVAMGAMLVVQTIAPAAIAIAHSLGTDGVGGAWTMSPIAGVLHLAARPRDPVVLEEWLGVWAIGLVAVGVWWIALVERRSVLSRVRPRGSPASSS